MKLPPTEVVIVVTPSYFERLAEVLNSTSKRTIANYFMWRSVIVASNFLNDQVRIRKVAYMSAMSGGANGQGGQGKFKCSFVKLNVIFNFVSLRFQEAQLNGKNASHILPKRKFLKKYMKEMPLHFNYFPNSRLSPSIGALYVRRYFNDQSKHHAIEIVENIRSSFIDILHKVKWMDEETKNEAILKAKALVAHIAYPDELTNNTKLEEYYQKLDMDENEYMLNALRLNHFKTEYAIRELYEPVNKTDWLTHATPAMTNAFYSALENSIRKYLIEHTFRFCFCILKLHFERFYGFPQIKN